MGKNGAPFKYSKQDGSIDLEKIQQLIDVYFNGNTVYSVPGFCLALDITKETLCRWKNGYTNDHKRDEEEEVIYEGLRDIVKKGLLRIEKYLLENEGKNVIKNMAALNHSFDYRDTKQIDSNINLNVSLGKYEDYAK